MKRTTPLVARTQLARVTPLSRTAGLNQGTGKNAATRKPLRQVSAKRQRQNRKRAAMADRLWPDRRDGTVMCECGRPGCQRRATDLHEPRFRSRLGSITDEGNAVPLSRECHDWVHTHEQEAQALGLAVHSWDTDGAA